MTTASTSPASSGNTGSSDTKPDRCVAERFATVADWEAPFQTIADQEAADIGAWQAEHDERI
jgi:hypothetical protein